MWHLLPGSHHVWVYVWCTWKIQVLVVVYRYTFRCIEWFSTQVQDLCLLKVISIKVQRPSLLVLLPKKKTTFLIRQQEGLKAFPDQVKATTRKRDYTVDVFASIWSFSFDSKKLATSICLLFRVGMYRSPPTFEGVDWVFPFLPNQGKTNILLQKEPETCFNIIMEFKITSFLSIPGVLLGVLDELTDRFPGERGALADDVDAFLCHLAIGAFVIGMSSFRTLWMSFSKPNWAMVTMFLDVLSTGMKTFAILSTYANVYQSDITNMFYISPKWTKSVHIDR